LLKKAELLMRAKLTKYCLGKLGPVVISLEEAGARYLQVFGALRMFSFSGEAQEPRTVILLVWSKVVQYPYFEFRFGNFFGS
jgi:hypothetical protein